MCIGGKVTSRPGAGEIQNQRPLHSRGLDADRMGAWGYDTRPSRHPSILPAHLPGQAHPPRRVTQWCKLARPFLPQGGHSAASGHVAGGAVARPFPTASPCTAPRFWHLLWQAPSLVFTPSALTSPGLASLQWVMAKAMSLLFRDEVTEKGDFHPACRP